MEPKFQKIISKYDYADQLAPGGFVIGGKPALTKIDGDLVGDYVIMTVRDPLLDYGGDPAEHRSLNCASPRPFKKRDLGAAAVLCISAPYFRSRMPH